MHLLTQRENVINKRVSWKIQACYSFQPVDYALGQPKIFGVSFLKPQTGEWTKLWRCAKFYGYSRDISPLLRSPEDKHFTYTKASVGCFRGSANVIKRPLRDVNLGTPSHFGPISNLGFEEWDPKNSGQPYYASLWLKYYEFVILDAFWT